MRCVINKWIELMKFLKNGINFETFVYNKLWKECVYYFIQFCLIDILFKLNDIDKVSINS